MSAYRFCRTDDIGLLVDALNRCGNDPPVTPAAFKRAIRDLQVWCSSCMVAFSGSDPVGVLVGAKRPSGTLVHRIAVHPDHRRQGHGRHLLASLGSKLAILGPSRIVAEVPETLAPACALFGASGYVQEATLTDYVLEHEGDLERERAKAGGAKPPGKSERAIASEPRERSGARGAPASERVGGSGGAKPPGLLDAGFVIPATVDDLAANGLVGDDQPRVCWERSVETLMARKGDIAGLAVASDERIEAYVLYVARGMGADGSGEAGTPASAPTQGPYDAFLASWGGAVEIVALRSLVDDGGARLKHLLARLRALAARGEGAGRAASPGTLRFPKVHPDEFSNACLETMGFRPAGGHFLYAATARAE